MELPPSTLLLMVPVPWPGSCENHCLVFPECLSVYFLTKLRILATVSKSLWLSNCPFMSKVLLPIELCRGEVFVSWGHFREQTLLPGPPSLMSELHRQPRWEQTGFPLHRHPPPPSSLSSGGAAAPPPHKGRGVRCKLLGTGAEGSSTGILCRSSARTALT